MEKGDFHYIEWQDLYRIEKPFQILIDLPKDAPDQRKTNIVFSDGYEESVTDIRDHFGDFNLDTHGFTYETRATKMKGEDFTDKAKIENKYIPECEAILREVMDGVDQVHFYNWLVSVKFGPFVKATFMC